MRRSFWSATFGKNAELEGAGGVASGSSTDGVPAGAFRTSFPSAKEKESVQAIMCQALVVEGANVFWFCQQVLAWLSSLASRNPSNSTTGQEKLFYRAVGAVGDRRSQLSNAGAPPPGWGMSVWGAHAIRVLSRSVPEQAEEHRPLGAESGLLGMSA